MPVFARVIPAAVLGLILVAVLTVVNFVKVMVQSAREPASGKQVKFG